MWNIKYFKSEAAQIEWMERNYYGYQIERIFVENGYAVEYRKLVCPRLPR